MLLSALLLLAPGRGSIGWALRHDPVAFFWRDGVGGDATEKLHDFKTGKGLLTIRGASCSQVELGVPPGSDTLVVDAGSIEHPEIGVVQLHSNQAVYQPKLFPTPYFDPGKGPPVGAAPSIEAFGGYVDSHHAILMYEGPRIVLLGPRTLRVARTQVLDDHVSLAYGSTMNCWAYSSKWNSLAIGQEEQDGMALIENRCAGRDGAFGQVLMIGKPGHRFSTFDGQVAGLIPRTDFDGFTAVFTNGTYRTYRYTGGRFRIEGPLRSFPARTFSRTGFDVAAYYRGDPKLSSLGGVYDATTRCLYDFSPDNGQLVTVSFRNSAQPRTSYAKLIDGPTLNVYMYTINGSRWIAIVDDHETKVDWYEKVAGGKTVFRFTSPLSPHDGFNAARSLY